MSGKVSLRGYIVVPVDEVAAVKAALDTHIALTRAEPGNLAFEVFQRADDECVFDVYEAFVDEEAFEAHQARAGASVWASVTANVERHYTVTREDGA